jgi:ubiquinone/menaquinone biosynthesis C-methylase UbiE
MLGARPTTDNPTQMQAPKTRPPESHTYADPGHSHPMPGTAEYQAHLKEEVEHFSKLYEEPEANASLFYKVPETWFEVERRAGELITEASGMNMSGHVVSRLNSRRGVRMLSLGSGPGGVELTFARRAVQAEIVCMDVNTELLELGRRHAAEGNLNVAFTEADLNLVELPTNEFDVVFCHAALHHVIELERLVEQIKRSLRPGGEFITVDVVTLNGYGMWPETRPVVQTLWQTLPSQFRLNHTGYAKPRTDEEIWEADTSAASMECIRSQDILPVLGDAFVNSVFVPYYSLSRRFFDTMYGPNYDLSRKLDRAIFEWIWELDTYYLQTQQLPPETFFGIYHAPD